MDKLESRVKAMKLKEHKDREKNIMEMINQEPTLTRKCVLAPRLPNSTEHKHGKIYYDRPEHRKTCRQCQWAMGQKTVKIAK